MYLAKAGSSFAGSLYFVGRGIPSVFCLMLLILLLRLGFDEQLGIVKDIAIVDSWWVLGQCESIGIGHIDGVGAIEMQLISFEGACASHSVGDIKPAIGIKN